MLTTSISSAVAVRFNSLASRLHVALVTLFLLACAAGAYTSVQFASYRTLSRSLAGVDTNVTLDGTEYHVADGSVAPRSALGFLREATILRIAYERVFAEHSPHIALPGVDPDRLNTSLQALRDAAEALAAVQQDRADAHAILTALYPISFLERMGSVESARQRFVHSGDANDLKSYRMSERSALRAYLHDVARFEAAYRRYVPHSDEKRVVAGWIVTESSDRDALEIMRTRYAQKLRDILQFNLCLYGVSPLCPYAQTSRTLPAAKEVDTDLAADAREVISEIFDDPHINALPIFALSDSACVEGRSRAPAFIAYPEHTPEGAQSATRVTPVSDIRFIRTDRLLQAPYYRQLSERGIDHVLASPLLHYSCMYMGSDIARVFALRRIQDLSSRLQLVGSDAAYGPSMDQLRGKLADEYVYERDGLAYLELAKKAAMDGRLSRANAKEVDELELASQWNTLGLEDMIALIAKTEYLDALAHQRGVAADLSAQNLFSARSGMQVTFLTHIPPLSRSGIFDLDRAPVGSGRGPYEFLSEIRGSGAERAGLIEDARDQLDSLGFTRS